MLKSVFTLSILTCLLLSSNVIASDNRAIIKSKSRTGRLALGVGLDAFRTDYNKPVEKYQLGIEANYFVLNKLAFSGGLEIWRRSNGGVTPVMIGTKFYPIDPIFLRGRVLLANNNAEFAVGGGYSHKLSDNWRFEGMGDFFVDAGEFALRFGFQYLF